MLGMRSTNSTDGRSLSNLCLSGYGVAVTKGPAFAGVRRVARKLGKIQLTFVLAALLALLILEVLTTNRPVHLDNTHPACRNDVSSVAGPVPPHCTHDYLLR